MIVEVYFSPNRSVQEFDAYLCEMDDVVSNKATGVALLNVPSFNFGFQHPIT